VSLHGKEKKEEEEVIGKQFGALPIDHLVTSPSQKRRGFLRLNMVK